MMCKVWRGGVGAIKRFRCLNTLLRRWVVRLPHSRLRMLRLLLGLPFLLWLILILLLLLCVIVLHGCWCLPLGLRLCCGLHLVLCLLLLMHLSILFQLCSLLLHVRL